MRTVAEMQDGAAVERAPRRVHDIPALDGLRGVAVLLVIWAHLRGFTFGGVWQWMGLLKDFSGFTGLYLFFCLSGFLLFLPYARAFVAGDSWPSVGRFYRRRMLRILPVYYSVMAIAILILLYAIATHMSGSFGYRMMVLRQLSTSVLGPTLLLLFDLQQRSWDFVMQWDTPLWSLAVEWQFYLVLPWLALGLRFVHRRGGMRWVVAGLLVLMGYGLLVRSLAAATFYHWGYANVLVVPQPAGTLLTLTYGMYGKFLEVFALGMLASLGYVAATTYQAEISRRGIGIKQRRGISAARIASLVTVVALLGLLANIFFMEWTGLIPIPPHAAIGRWPQEAPAAWLWGIAGPWLISCCTCGLIVGAVLGPVWLRQLWAWSQLRRAGLISYSLYVWHARLQDDWNGYWDAHLGGQPIAVRIVAYLVLVALVGMLSYLIIERPFLRARRRSAPLALA